MYDTLNIWNNTVGAGNLHASTLYLSNVRETTNKENGEVYFYGNLDNLKISISLFGISIKGSLAKYYLPDNSYTLNRNQAREAIEKLSDTLHIDISNGKVTRLDVSANFIMKHATKQYYDILGLRTYFDRIQATPNTLYYQSRAKEKKRTMVFYDKAREIGDRNAMIPDVYLGVNLLRYESRWITRLPQQLKEQEVTGRMLYDSRFYSKIIDLWAENYFKIEKQRNINNDAMSKIKTPTEAIDFIFAIALQKMQPDEVQSILEDMKQRNIFEDAKYYSRVKKKLKDIANKADISETNELVRELDNEVKNILSYKR